MAMAYVICLTSPLAWLHVVLQMYRMMPAGVTFPGPLGGTPGQHMHGATCFSGSSVDREVSFNFPSLGGRLPHRARHNPGVAPGSHAPRGITASDKTTGGEPCVERGTTPENWLCRMMLAGVGRERGSRHARRTCFSGALPLTRCRLLSPHGGSPAPRALVEEPSLYGAPPLVDGLSDPASSQKAPCHENHSRDERSHRLLR